MKAHTGETEAQRLARIAATQEEFLKYAQLVVKVRWFCDRVGAVSAIVPLHNIDVASCSFCMHPCVHA